MIMPMMEHFGNQIFVMYLKVIRSWLILGFFQRLSILLISGYTFELYQAQPFLKKVELFFQGARFDLLVFGFFLLPVALMLELSALLGIWSKIERHWGRYWCMGCWIIWSVLSFFGGLHFVRTGRFWTLVDLKETGLPVFVQSESIWSFTAIMVGVLIVGILSVMKMEIPEFVEGVSKKLLLIPLLVTGLCARGTVTAHHLRKEDSFITSHDSLNELALNPAWQFDKYPSASP